MFSVESWSFVNAYSMLYVCKISYRFVICTFVGMLGIRSLKMSRCDPGISFMAVQHDMSIWATFCSNVNLERLLL